MRRLSFLLLAALLTACGRGPAGPVTPASRDQATPRLQGKALPGQRLTIKLTPESSEAAARNRAAAWAPDAELRFVGWLVYRGESMSTVNHTFYSPEKAGVLAVTTFFQDGWQTAVDFQARVVVGPMEALHPLPAVRVTARDAFENAIRFFDPVSTNPLRALTLMYPRKANDPMWLVAGGNNVIYQNARTGEVVGVPPYGFERAYPTEWGTPNR